MVIPNRPVLCASPLEALPDGLIVSATGPQSKLVYLGPDTFVPLVGARRSRWRDITVELVEPTATAFGLSNSFRCSWSGVTIQGKHGPTTGDQFQGQVGLSFADNAGDNRLIDCDLNNLGVGVNTATIQNQIIGGVIGSCWRGVQGGDPTGKGMSAGMSIIGTTFTSKPDLTDRHVYVNGSANSWWLNNVWMEGCDTAVEVGVSGVGGPFQFAWHGGKASATSRCLVLNHARLPTLSDVRLDGDGAAAPAYVTIDATNCPTGAATNLTLETAYDVNPAWFPSNWTVIGRGMARLG